MSKRHTKNAKTKSKHHAVICKVCGNSKLPANERIKTIRVCFQCTKKIVPDHIPIEQHIRYLKRIGYEMVQTN